MSAKQEATYHGGDVVTRLRLYGPESDYENVMSEAAEEIERLREAVLDAERRAFPKEGLVIQLPAQQSSYLRSRSGRTST